MSIVPLLVTVAFLGNSVWVAPGRAPVFLEDHWRGQKSRRGGGCWTPPTLSRRLRERSKLSQRAPGRYLCDCVFEWRHTHIITCLLSVLSVSWILSSKLLNPLLFQFISGNSASTSSLREPYRLNWYKFLINVLSSSVACYVIGILSLFKNDILHNIVCFCLQTLEMVLSWMMFNLNK